MGMAWKVARKVANTRHRLRVERAPNDMTAHLADLRFRPNNDDLEEARAAIQVVMVELGLVDILMAGGMTFPDAVEHLTEKLWISAP